MPFYIAKKRYKQIIEFHENQKKEMENSSSRKSTAPKSSPRRKK